MYQAEEFDVVECDECRERELKIRGKVEFTHTGGEVNGVDMRAEVGLLTRNIVIHGEMEETCYGDNFCDYFDYDTYGGHTQVLVGFNTAIFEGVELHHMGQQVLGRYPIHYHRVRDIVKAGSEAYVRELSIHDCFSRCVTVHATQGLLVEDVVGYNTLGHCFFLEDGNEERNILRHNLGLVTKAGMLLPSDRDKEMCERFRDDIVGDYVPDGDVECRGVATFWIAHPNNILENNAAAGSEEFGIFYVFHQEPTGPSGGLLPPFHGERSPLLGFSNNKAHSNFRAGLLLDRGVKIDASSEADGREFLALIDNARFMPHENQDILAPRVPAVLDGLTAYKNNGHGAFVRGGDIFITNSMFADNGVGLTMASEQTLPHDAGSHQQVTNSIFVGESDNRGTNGGGNLYWGQGVDGEERSLPNVEDYPFRGVQLHDGPVLVQNCDFIKYWPTTGNNSALAFKPHNPGQSSPQQVVNSLTFDDESLKIWFGVEGPWYGDYNDDGDLTQIMSDLSGAVSGTPGAYLLRPSNWIARDDECELLEDFGAVMCTGLTFGQLYIQANTKDLELTITRGEDTAPLTLSGANKDDPQFPDTNIYMPVLQLGEEDIISYHLQWNEDAANDITLMPLNFPESFSALLSLSYTTGSTFAITYEEWDQMRDEVTESQAVDEGQGVDDVIGDPSGKTYYFDDEEGLLYVKIVNPYSVEGWDYCSVQGCVRWNILSS